MGDKTANPTPEYCFHEVKPTLDGLLQHLVGAPLDRNGEAGLLLLDSMQRVGKKAAGRVLDGRTWDEMPGVGV